MWTLGLNWIFHDAAACLLDERGVPVAFGEEERFRRSKHAVQTAPRLSAAFCLREAGIAYEELDTVAVGWDIPRMFPDWYAEHDARQILLELLGKAYAPGTEPRLEFVPHHTAHALSTYYAAGATEAAVLVVDGSGETESTSIYTARGGEPPVRVAEWGIPDSLGGMYEGLSRALGLGRFGAGKAMGLAAYGRGGPTPPVPLRIDEEDGPHSSLDVPADISYPEFATVWEGWFRDSLGELPPPHRLDESPEAIATAWSCQELVESGMQWLAAQARAAAGTETLCLAGGVALNCSANGLLPPPLYVPPFPHDSGVALGAAWAVTPPPAEVAPITPYLGLGCSPLDVDVATSARPWEPFDAAAVAARLVVGEIGAIVDERAEVGPRALGHRSIIGLPRPAAARDRLNERKGRERWRPLAPIARAADAPELWEDRGPLLRYMIGATTPTDYGREVLPAAVHVDGTARAQVIGEAPVHGARVVEEILAALPEAGAPPVLINTSFNGPGEPIVNTAQDAMAAFDRGLGLDFVVVGDRVVTRA